MRVGGRAAAAALAALLVGFAVSWVAAAWLRSSTPEANLLWGVAPPSKVAIWTLSAANGATVRIEAGAEVDERVGRLGEQIGDQLGEVFGQEDVVPDIPERAGGDFAIRLAPLILLALMGTAIFLLMQKSGATRPADIAAAAGVAGAVNGIALALLATVSKAGLGFDVEIVRAGVDVSVSPAPVLVLGFAWAALFAALGTAMAPAVAEKLSTVLRAAGAGLKRAAIVAPIVAVVCLIVLAIAQRGGGGDVDIPVDRDLTPLGIVLLGLNVVAGAVVLAHGAAMNIDLDAGPLSGFTRIGYIPSGAELSAARWLFILVPILACIAAGRAMRNHVDRKNLWTSAAVFGLAWGVVLAALAVLLRVNVLSNFDIGSLEGGGGMSINPLAALAFGVGAATILSLVGMSFGKPTAPIAEAPQPIPTPAVAPERVVAPPPGAVGVTPAVQPTVGKCGSCGRPLPADDRFCSACGAPA